MKIEYINRNNENKMISTRGAWIDFGNGYGFKVDDTESVISVFIRGKN